MKYIITILVISTLLIRPLNAQEISFGAVAGPNFSTFQTELFDGQFRIAFHAGVVVKLELSEKWVIHPEFLYSQQGMTWRDGDAKIKRHNNYFAIPMLMQYSPNENIAILFGPGVGILLKAVEINEYPGYYNEVDVIDEYNRVDIGLNLGFEYYFSTHFTMGFRYYNGLMNANIPYKYTNAHFSIPVTYMF